MGTVHDCFFIQTHHLVPSQPSNLAKNEQFEGDFDPNYMSAWLYTTWEAFQSQMWFTNTDYKAWDGNPTCGINSTTTFSAKPTPNFGQNRATPGLIWPK